MIIKNSYDVESKKKLIGVINNLMYKKIISNYKILLDDGFDESECTKLVFSTVSTLDICNKELLKFQFIKFALIFVFVSSIFSHHLDIKCVFQNHKVVAKITATLL